MGVKILHTADLHIGSSFDDLPPEKAFDRRERQYAVLEEIISAADRNDVDAILICGDLFDRPSVTSDIADRVSRILSGTYRPIFITPGNHDHFHARSPYNISSWPVNVHIFKSQSIERVELDGLTVYGAGFTDPFIFRPLLSGFHTSPAITGGLPCKPSVMALHGDLNPSEPRYDPVYASDIAASGLDFLALGHIHARTDPQRTGGTVYAYCGCPEGRGFDETGQKGCYIAELDDHVKIRFIPLGGVRYDILTVDLTGCPDPSSGIIGALPGDSAAGIFRIVLKGEILPEKLRIGETAERIAPYVYHAVFSDRTSLPRSVWERAGEDTLGGLFLSALREKLTSDAADDETRELIELAAHYGIAALNGGEAPGA